MKYIRIYEELTEEQRLKNRKSNAINDFLFFISILYFQCYNRHLIYKDYDVDFRRSIDLKIKNKTYLSVRFLQASLFREDTDKTDFIYVQFSRLGNEEFDFYEYIVDLTESYAKKYNDEALAKNYSESFEIADLAMLESGFYALKPEDLKEIIQTKKEDFELWRDAKKYNL